MSTDRLWGAAAAAIEPKPDFSPQALAGLDGFSHDEAILPFFGVAGCGALREPARANDLMAGLGWSLFRAPERRTP